MASGATGGQHGPDDRELISKLLDGDQDATRQFVARYDRLIRYTIFRTARRQCTRDPGWLDARANEAWTGIVQSLRRVGLRNLPPKLSAYLIQIARNKTLDAVARSDSPPVVPFDTPRTGADAASPASDPADDPLAVLENLEQMEVLRDCMSGLREDDRVICAEIGLIMERRWKEAAERLGMAESTLRSRWEGIVGRLRACLEKKTEKKFAPPPDRPDS